MPDSPKFDMIRRSSIYQRILGEGVKAGEIREAREILIRQRTRRFGDINPSTLAALGMIQDISRLEALYSKIIEPDLDS